MRALLRSVFGLEVTGLEHLPAEGAFILAANHHNYLDAVVLGVTMPRHIKFLVMPRVYHASPLHPLLHRRMGSISSTSSVQTRAPSSAPFAPSRRAGSSGSSPRGPSAVRAASYRGSPASP